jgi:hypothetical protein
VVEEALAKSQSIVISVQKTGDARTQKRFIANEAAGKSSGGSGATGVARVQRTKEPLALDEDDSDGDEDEVT